MHSFEQKPLFSIPVLETARLRLRAHDPRDLNDSFLMWSDPATVRFIGGRPATLQQSWQRVLTYVGHWHLMNFGYWLVEDRISGEFLGEMGYADFKREGLASHHGQPEAGWAFRQASWGRGYATEALHAAEEWLAKTLKPAETFCIVNPENHVSLRVAQKCGYGDSRMSTYADQPILLLSKKHDS